MQFPSLGSLAWLANEVNPANENLPSNSWPSLSASSKRKCSFLGYVWNTIDWSLLLRGMFSSHYSTMTVMCEIVKFKYRTIHPRLTTQKQQYKCNYNSACGDTWVSEEMCGWENFWATIASKFFNWNISSEAMWYIRVCFCFRLLRHAALSSIRLLNVGPENCIVACRTLM